MSEIWVLETNRLSSSHIVPEYTKESADTLARCKLNGDLIPEDVQPKEAFAAYREKVVIDADVFIMGSLFGFSQKVANAIRDFDYGEGGGLKPFKAFQFDRETPILGSFYVLNFVGIKPTIIPEESDVFYQIPSTSTYNLNSEKFANGKLVVRPEAQEGVDVWMDPDVARSNLFLSGRLRDAIKSAKPKGRFPCWKCHIK